MSDLPGARLRPRRRRRFPVVPVVVGVIAAIVCAGGVTIASLRPAQTANPPGEVASVVTTSPAPSPEPTEEGCGVAFDADGVAALDRVAGGQYGDLPLLPREGDRVFAGWYPDAAAAAARNDALRVGWADEVTCGVTLVPGWVSETDLLAQDVGVPILMYHQFTDDPAGVDGPLRLNWAYTGDFDKHMAFLADTDVYLPTWKELHAFVAGDLSLPARSAIVTDDDADGSWLRLAVPIVTKHRILTTSFVITMWRHEPTPSPFVLQRSHTDRMHDAGAGGNPLMTTLGEEAMVADLEASAQILGAKEVIAYPFGAYSDASKQAVAKAGFWFGVTTEDGLVHRGSDPLALPRVRVNYGTTVDEVAARIG